MRRKISNTGTRVRVYRNLSTQDPDKRWSIKAKDTGLVIMHAAQVQLSNAVPVISEAGRQRVIAEQRKNVHCYIEGDLLRIGCEGVMLPDGHGHALTYNPYRQGAFVDHCDVPQHGPWPHVTLVGTCALVHALND